MGRRASLRLVVGLATVAMVTAACSGSSDSGGGSSTDASGAPTGGSFSAQIGEPSFLAPMSNCYESECAQIVNTINTGLLTIDPETSEQVLDIAESIETDDSKVYTIKLKDGWKFHNGEPVDAESFVRSWNYSAYGPNATLLGFFFSSIEGYDDMQGDKPKAKELSGVKVVDDLTIEITLTEPFSQFPLVMSYTQAWAPIAKECLADLRACNEEPIGNGPYQVAGPWQHNDNITLERYEDYQGENVGNADEIEFKIYGDLITPFKDWQAGNIDITGVDPTQVPQAQALAGDRFVNVDSGGFAYLGFPLYQEEFQDVRIRQALSLAVDRDTIIDKIYGGLYTTAQDVIAPFVVGSRDDACEFCTYDPERAKQLYDEAGGLPGDTITLWFNNDGGHEQFMQAVANGWRNDLGLDYEFDSQPFTPYLAALGRDEAAGPFRLSWGPDYPSPENYLDPVYGEGTSNYSEYENQEFLDLIAEGDAAATVEEGVPSYQAAADIVLEDLPVIPLWFTTTAIVHSENVSNVIYDPLRDIVYTDVMVN